MGPKALIQYVEHLSTKVDENQRESSHGHPARTDGGTDPCKLELGRRASKRASTRASTRARTRVRTRARTRARTRVRTRARTRDRVRDLRDSDAEHRRFSKAKGCLL